LVSSYDTAVIGAGSFGAWTAWHLQRAGQRVLLVDAWGPAHSRASSGGESRIIRMGYGADEIYTRMAQRSLELWKQAAPAEFLRTGVLWLARENHPYSTGTVTTLSAAGVPHEILTVAEIAHRYPQMRFGEPEVFGIYEPESGALFARRAVARVCEGIPYVTMNSAWPCEIRAANYVYACGPWLPKVFPEILGGRITPTRQEVFFFAPPAGDRSYSPESLPVWIDFIDPRGAYGFPDLESRGFKLALDRHGPACDPDTLDRRTTAEGLAEAYRFLEERFPALRGAPLTESRVCQYENTSSGDFLIDRHPDHPNVWLVGGGSGHGFKHGPAVGEYVCGRILRQVPEAPRFSLSTKLLTENRRVY
jgi:glycine/D-amino acid oxidase-like deaminating enzyme